MMNMKKYFLAVLFIASVNVLYAQEITTVILLRHAEKMADGSKDPQLTEEGKARAARLANLLKDTKVDAIFSTTLKRTQNTVAPLALSKGITVLPYQAMNGEAIDDLLRDFKGKTIVICGHSNTTPWTINYLIGKEEYKDFADSDYDNLVIVDLTEKGKAKTKWLTY
jgi:2,3-bisphosphoglycerate-dependent phosphoglycerate mutase